MLSQVLASLLENFQVLLGIRFVQRLSRGNLWPPTMHLQRTGGGDDDHSGWGKATNSAFDVAKLLHTHVSPEASFRKDIPSTRRLFALLSSREFQSNTVSENG